MDIIKSPDEWMTRFSGNKADSMGFVPTMGALHEGHLSLVRTSLSDNDKTTVSIFLNKTQFNDSSDYEKYPVSLENDIRLLEEAGIDYLFLPEFDGIYPDRYLYRVSENGFSRELCGAARPGHFDGVLTVVLKLLQIVEPTRAYFGEKDYQQYLLVRDMARAFFLKTKIIPCQIIREQSGLAMSSRNRRLSAAGLNQASAFYRHLSSGNPPEQIRKDLETTGFEVDYITLKEGRLYGAVWLEGIRLIDNVKV